jgi:methylated-DNA-protein-cysteine methyltransferase-like protein
LKEDIVAETDASIVPSILNRYLNPDAPCFQNKERILMPAKKAATEKLKQITPSGKRDESFFEAVYQIVRLIPRGRVTSYGAIAAALGARSSARMVGWAMNGSHRIRPKVPAHRVVNRQGLLTGKIHFSDPDQMQKLLEKEGIKVVNDQVQDFQKCFWDPILAIGL